MFNTQAAGREFASNILAPWVAVAVDHSKVTILCWFALGPCLVVKVFSVLSNLAITKKEEKFGWFSVCLSVRLPPLSLSENPREDSIQCVLQCQVSLQHT